VRRAAVEQLRRDAADRRAARHVPGARCALCIRLAILWTSCEAVEQVAARERGAFPTEHVLRHAKCATPAAPTSATSAARQRENDFR